MSHARYTDDEIVQRGEAIYERDIRAQVEPDHRGKFLVINTETSEYVLDADDLAASKRAKARFPNATLFTKPIGYPAAYRLGGHFLVKPPC